jgi:hypothetical protein
MEGNFTAVTYDPRGNGVAVAGTAAGNVLRSSDAGWSFVDWSEDLPGARVDDLVVGADGVVWAALWGEGLWSRGPAGAWRRVMPAEVEIPVRRLGLDPMSAQNIWIAAAERGLWASTDGGRSWTRQDLGACRVAWDVAVSPTDGRAWVGCEDGRVVAGDRGEPFRALSPIGAVGDVRTLTWLASDAGVLVAGTSEGEVVRWSGGGVLSTNNPVAHASVLAGAVAPGGDRAAFLTTQGLQRTVDHGRHWVAGNLTGGHVDALALDRDGLTVAAWVHGRGILWSEDGGKRWDQRGAPRASGFPTQGDSVVTSRLEASTSDGSVRIRPEATDVTVLVRDGSALVLTPELEPRISGLVSHDRGKTWALAGKGAYQDARVEDAWGAWLRFDRRVRLAVAELGVTRLLVRDAAGAIRFVAGDRVGTVSEAGRVRVTGSLPPGLQTCFTDPGDPTVLYAGTATGVQVSADLGATWEPYVR